jgi:hypothetical protein
MSRLVRKPQVPDLDLHIAGLEDVLQSGLAGMRMANAEPGDNYLERMVKYVPAEVIAFSMVINAILDQAMKAGGQSATMAGFPVASIAIGALGLGVVLTPLFCCYVREDGDAWIVNSVMSTIAFPLWAYLMGAVAFDKYHDGNLAAILVLTFTAVSGLVTPRARKPRRRRERKEAAPQDGPRLVESLTG